MALNAKDEIEEFASHAAQSLILGPWPDDRDERIEAKLDKLLSNHVPHVEARLSRLERLFLQKQRWAFWTGIATLGAVIYLIAAR